MSREIKELNTSRMMFDPNKQQFVRNIKTKIIESKKINAYELGVREKSLYEYITLMYDINSPLWTIEKDYLRRKYRAASLAEFPFSKKKKGEFEDKINKVVLGESRPVNEIIMAFIALFALPEYYQLIVYNVILSYETRKVLEGGSSPKSMDVMDQAATKTKELQQKLFHSAGYDESTELRRALYAHVNHERKKLALRPEEIVKTLREKGKLDDDFSPYDTPVDEYAEMVKMKFMGDK